MQKTILLLCIMALGVAPNLSAQNRTDVKRIEFEIAGGFIKSTSFFDSSYDFGFQSLYEFRYNMIDLPYDLGLQLSGALHLSENRSIHSNSYIANVFSIIGFADYNYRPLRRLSFFCGLGTGVGIIHHGHRSGSWNGNDPCVSFVVVPRIGVEFVNHIRLTFDYKFMPKEYSYSGITLGIVFGGGWEK